MPVLKTPRNFYRQFTALISAYVLTVACLAFVGSRIARHFGIVERVGVDNARNIVGLSAAAISLLLYKLLLDKQIKKRRASRSTTLLP